MKRFVALALFGAAVVGCSDTSTAPVDGATLAPTAATFARTPSRKLAGRYIVVLRNTVTDVEGAAHALIARHGGRLRHTYKAALRGFALELSDSAAAALRAEPGVAYVEEDQTVSATGIQTGADWGLDRMDQRSLPLDGSFSYGGDGTGVTAYIIDTGINFTHSEFGGRAVTGVDEVTSGGTAADCNGHGTHVAGTVGGTTYGVAKKVKLVAVRVLDCSGNGTSSGVIAGLDWVAAHRLLPAVANLSLGGDFSQALNDAIEHTIAAGVSVVVAAGNSAVDACTSSPASAPHAITTGATDRTDTFASFSNYGSCVKINAPGVSITSAWIGSNSATAAASGTSMASPHVAGAAAAYLQSHPSATPAQVQSALVGAATTGTVQSIASGTPNLLLYSAAPAPTPAPSPAPTGTQLSEDWSSGVASSRWVSARSGTGILAAGSGTLSIGSQGIGSAIVTLTTVSSYSLDAAADAGVVVEVLNSPNPLQHRITLFDANGNGFGIYMSNSYLMSGPVVGSTLQTGNWAASVMPAFVRFRTSTGRYFVETSSDGLSWTVRRTDALPAGTATTSMKLRIDERGYSNSASQVWAARYGDITWGGTGASPVPSPVAQLSEDWESGSIGASWTYTQSGPGKASVQSGALSLGTDGVGSAIATVSTAASYSLDAAGDAGVVFRVLDSPASLTHRVMLVDANGNGFGIYMANGYFMTAPVTGGALQSGGWALNVVPAYVRFRRSAAGYVVETSSDKVSWTVRRSEALPAGTITTSMKLRFDSRGYSQSSGQVWAARYDDIVWK
jgi:subtilisin family serine protease